jgi:Family of unknown function (DUF5675)
MRHATLIRSPSTDHGTFGILKLDDGSAFFTAELPWRDNQHDISCIPAGTYTFKKVNSPKHGECYMGVDIPDRNAVEIHVANYAGDVTKGFRSDLEGCIALGKSFGLLRAEGYDKHQIVVQYSSVAIMEFIANTKLEDLQITIVEE